ncbi:MAG: VOC family protein [Polyangiaceae bacterium]|nr:VOC family protein [Polyangiaceae bacterium]
MSGGSPCPRLHHVALGAQDPERVAAFYRDVLGLVEVRRSLLEDSRVRSVWLDLGGAVLMVERTEAGPRRVDGIGAGPFLLAVTAVGDVVAHARRLEEAGVVIEGRTEHTCYARDPEGNRVAVSSYPLRDDRR